MMSNRLTDTLFQLIHSLEKSEKRHFKLYIKRSSAKEDLKIIQLFDALDKLKATFQRIVGVKEIDGGDQRDKCGASRNTAYQRDLPIRDEDQRQSASEWSEQNDE